MCSYWGSLFNDMNQSCTFKAIIELICQNYWLEFPRLKQYFFIDIILFLEFTKIWVDFEHELWMTFLSLCDWEDLFKELLSKFWGKILRAAFLKEVLKPGDISPKQTKQCPLVVKSRWKRIFVARYIFNGSWRESIANNKVGECGRFPPLQDRY